MKKSFKTFVCIIVVILLISFCDTISGQELQGKVHYISKTNITTNFGQRQLSKAQKARIKERLNQSSTKNHILTFNKSVSLFTEKENVSIQQRNSRNGSGFKRFKNNQNLGTYYKDLANLKYVTQKDIYGKQFLIEDRLKEWNWQTTDEIKIIGKYTCFKATIILPNENENTDTIITAWYTIEVPVSTGPELFWGLPGLIIELHTPNIVYLCSKIELNKKDTITIKLPKKGKKVSQETYNKILVKKIEEVKEQQKNRRSRSIKN
jgi:GLPGLI family protein